MAISAAIGMSLAVIISVKQGPNGCLTTSPCWDVADKIKVHGILLVPPGIIIGAIIGSFSKNFGIYGTMNLYNEHKPKLKDYALLKDIIPSGTEAAN